MKINFGFLNGIVLMQLLISSKKKIIICYLCIENYWFKRYCKLNFIELILGY